MKINQQIFNIGGYTVCIALSIFFGWLSFLGGNDLDYVQKISNNIIPLLLTLLVLYSTLTIHLINELRKIENNSNLSSVIIALRSNIIAEIVLILIVFTTFIFKGVLLNHFPDCSKSIQVIANSIVVFTFLFFIWVIIDVTMGLYDLIINSIK